MINIHICMPICTGIMMMSGREEMRSNLENEVKSQRGCLKFSTTYLPFLLSFLNLAVF